MLEVATNKVFPLTTAGNCIKPTWSWDSKSIYYSSVAAGSDRNEDIWVARDLNLKAPPSKAPPRKARARPTVKRAPTTKTTHK